MPLHETRVTAVFATDEQAPSCSLPLAVASVSAGFPSPADDYLEGVLDLNQHLIKHPAATFFVRVTGDSMIDAGIHDGDLLLVDRSLEMVDGKVVIAIINAELLVKRVRKVGARLFLLPENQAYKPIEVQENMDFELWGVVTYVIHSL
ncbi:MAG: translesion error-prone DNA polymerase V autoproteolytic subunit [Pseudomonadota bacterium]|nr:translesion error-prone DNA polymerase V autoproteolytic subunit [Pseudomonadota bacterium]MEA3240388.1 translesion error-prone DNA polymerase V autoproteolytic subunit [Pseudomonadota bacterium]